MRLKRRLQVAVVRTVEGAHWPGHGQCWVQHEGRADGSQAGQARERERGQTRRRLRRGEKADKGGRGNARSQDSREDSGAAWRRMRRRPTGYGTGGGGGGEGWARSGRLVCASGGRGVVVVYAVIESEDQAMVVRWIRWQADSTTTTTTTTMYVCRLATHMLQEQASRKLRWMLPCACLLCCRGCCACGWRWRWRWCWRWRHTSGTN
ncbi:uncharacterized protein J3D65DRAFT_344624 [Phyllosticta citribraziliensis]|uniref:Uncharacterized protein n=1 Tax=Phyllosticta citribraziliensis TaxID=989973 RepID=A0ABR1LU94_9PEZI